MTFRSSFLLLAAIVVSSSCTSRVRDARDAQGTECTALVVSDEVEQRIERASAMTPHDLETIERHVQDDTAAMATRAELRRYYQVAMRAPDQRTKYRAKALANLSWMVRRCPGSALLWPAANDLVLAAGDTIALRQIKHLWSEALHSDRNNASVVVNASSLLLLLQADANGLRSIEAAQRELPGNYRANATLAQVYLAMSEDDAQASGTGSAFLAAALARYRDVIENPGPRAIKLEALGQACTLAFHLGQIDRAESYAKTLLQEARTVGGSSSADAYYRAQLTLGLVAIRKGSISQAKQHLLEATRIAPTGMLMSFGPNMELAKELLERGERDTVIDYLKRCEALGAPANLIDNWISELDADRNPDFGPNTSYW